MAIGATNQFNIEANRQFGAIDYGAPYAPTTQSYHGFGIQVGGVYIGRITDWTPASLDREATHVFELNPFTWGQPVDIVPGRAQNFQLSFTRAEVWGEELERAFGEADVYSLLTNQRAPFVIDEVLLRGNQLYRQWRYLGCWFTEKNVNAFSGEGDGKIIVEGSMMYVNRVRIR